MFHLYHFHEVDAVGSNENGRTDLGLLLSLGYSEKIYFAHYLNRSVEYIQVERK